jgi:hypothetical protein
MATQQPVWKLIANLGDAHPFDCGGYFIYQDQTGVYPPEGVLLVEPTDDADVDDHDDDQTGRYLVYRFVLDRLKEVQGYLVPERYQPDWPHPVARYEEWFTDSLDRVANCFDQPDIRENFCSADPLIRAWAYRAVGDYHGFENLDAYPGRLTREQVEEKFSADLQKLRTGSV